MPILTPKTRDRIFYSDFSSDFSVIPGKADLSRKLNENAVKESIRNIVFTNRLEKPFQPTFGCSIRDILFENVTPTTIQIAKTRILDTLKTYESRAEFIDAEITADLGSNAIEISIVFRVLNADAPQTLQLRVDRTR